MGGHHVGQPPLHCRQFQHQALQHFYFLRVALLAVVQEPRAALGGGHVGELADAVVIEQVAEGVAVATVGRVGLILQLLEVDELCLVDEHEVERLRVGGALAVLRDDGGVGTVVERQRVLPVHGLDDGVFPSPRLGGLLAPGIVYVLDEAPAAQVGIPRRDDVRPHALRVGAYQCRVRAGHALHVAAQQRGSNESLAYAAPAHHCHVLGHQGQHVGLCRVKILFLSLHGPLSVWLLVSRGRSRRRSAPPRRHPPPRGCRTNGKTAPPARQ